MQSTVENTQEQDTNPSGQSTQRTDASRSLLFKHQENNFLNRLKSRQQLEVSHDSPFNRNDFEQSDELQTKRLKEERARHLRDETEAIKRQLQLVRERLEELKASNESSLRPPSDRSQPISAAKDGYLRTSNSNFGAIEAHSNETDAIDSEATQPTAPAPAKRASLLKLRPLTGKVDCPNCACDRRTSVCDLCIRFVTVRPQAVPPSEINCEPDVAAAATGGSQQPPVAASRTTSSVEPPRKGELAQDQSGEDENKAAKLVVKIPSETHAPSRLESMGSLLRGNDAPATRAQPVIDQTFRAKETTVDDSIVPGRLYTIGKSLNDKRSKLAQAIQELQTMMDRVRRREERLEQERKVVQLYRSQWRFGPAVGGPAGSARARLGNQATQRQPTYQSRLDSNLQRDSRAVMGFQQQQMRQPSTPDLQSSRYQANRTRAASSSQAAWRSKPTGQPNGASRTLSSKSRSKSLESLKSMARPPNRATHTTTTEPVRGKTSSDGAHLGKASSETNLEEGSNSPENIREEIEEEIRDDDDGDVKNSADNQAHDESEKNVRGIQSNSSHENEARRGEQQLRTENPRDGLAAETRDRVSASNEQTRERDRVKTWVPVFGETEIKTVKKIRPSRKMQVLHSVNQQRTTNTFESLSSSRSGGKQISTYNHSYGSTNSNGSMRRSTTFVRSKSNLESTRPLTARPQQPAKCNPPNSTLVEARKRIHFASDLLDSEQRDSKTSNQLIINKRVAFPTPKPRRHLASAVRLPPANEPRLPNSPQADSLGPQNLVDGEQDRVAQHLIQDASGELLKLEQMIAEQHRLLAKMAAERSPGASRCPSPCCQTTTSTSSLCSSPCCQQQQQTRLKTVTVMNTNGASPPKTTGSASPRPSSSKANPLVNHLKDKLNKTKTRLARTLEEEREKHEQLKLKIDSSLRKQSDLESENELLKRSLNKCIDTCLRDISNTFESISDTLNNSFNVASDTRTSSSAANEDGNLLTAFSSAAQLIEDNRHLKKMKSVIEMAESQRKRIFDELKEEKQRSSLLEAQLEQNRLEMNELIETKRRLENQLAPSGDVNEQNVADHPQAASDSTNGIYEPTEVRIETNSDTFEQQAMTTKQQAAAEAASQQQLKPGCSWQQTTPELDSLACDTTNANSSTMTEDSNTFTSVDAYRQYIQTMSPDLDAIRRERKMILSEFDNIKKMLSEMDN